MQGSSLIYTFRNILKMRAPVWWPIKLIRNYHFEFKSKSDVEFETEHEFELEFESGFETKFDIKFKIQFEVEFEFKVGTRTVF